MSLTRLEWAQWMAAKGISVFVVEPNSKRPLDGYSWYLRQTKDPAIIEQWFNQIPNSNYGVHLGENYVVIDLDVKPDANGVRAFEELCREHGVDNFLLELDTLIVQTPGGGYHLYFQSPFPCGLSNDFPNGIDVRGVTGYVVGPGSEDSRGEWSLINDDDIAPLPKWLAAYIRPPGNKDPHHDVPVVELDEPENVQYALDWLLDREPAFQGKNGDDWTYETVQFMRDFGLSEDKIFETLNAEWNGRCDPPWGHEELIAKIRNAWAYGQNRPGIKSPTWKAQRVVMGHGGDQWAKHLTEDALAELFHPTHHLKLVAHDQPDDDDIPDDVSDDEMDPVTGEAAESIWSDINEFSNETAVREYVIYNWLIAHGITHMIAKRGTGKSTVALDMAFHIACDLDWCGIPTQKGWKVIYICGEDDVGMRLNARAWKLKHDVSPDNGRFLVAKDIIKLTDPLRLNMRLREMIKWADGVPVVVILDTWQRATSGWGKNDAELMELAVERAEMISKHMRGPLLSCVHPPKDGRMTVTGAGVQEDTSSGIFTLERVMDGVRMNINRVKGPGEGKYMKFDLKPIVLPGFDAFDKPLTGLVAIKTGGDEEEDTIEAADKRDRELMGWANAIRGCERFPHENNEYEAPSSLNIKNVSNLLGQIIEDAYDKDSPNHEDAKGFRTRYLSELEHFISGGLKTLTKYKISERLSEHFNKPTVAPEVSTSDGKWIMKFKMKSSNNKKSGYKAKNPQKIFQFGERKIAED